jgi:hypothetical protein
MSVNITSTGALPEKYARASAALETAWTANPYSVKVSRTISAIRISSSTTKTDGTRATNV